MSSFSQALHLAWDLLYHRDPYLMHVLWVTAKVAAIPTFIATVVGVPLGVGLGIGRFRGRGLGLAIANAGLGLPPVIVGVVFVLLTLPVSGPLGGLHLLFTLNGVYVVQTVLAFPVVLALTASAVRVVSPGLLDQARGFQANRWQVASLAVREARVGIIAAIIAAVGSALSEVGAVVLAGGNIQGEDQTLASAALQQIDAANFIEGLAIGLILLGVILIVSAALTLLQYRGGASARVRRVARRS